MTEIEQKEKAMQDSEWAAVDALRARGFAVTVFTPEELGEADPDTVQDMMVERGWQAIGDLN